MTIDNKRLALLEGKNPLPEEVSTGGMFYRSPMRSITIPPPNYSTSPDDRERLWGYLMGKEEMWKAFKTAILTAKIGEPYDTDLIVYLFSFIDGIPRWVSLLSEWLGMEETREKFGWVECPEYARCSISDGEDGSLEWCKNYDAGECDCKPFGRIRADWAKEG